MTTEEEINSRFEFALDSYLKTMNLSIKKEEYGRDFIEEKVLTSETCDSILKQMIEVHPDFPPEEFTRLKEQYLQDCYVRNREYVLDRRQKDEDKKKTSKTFSLPTELEDFRDVIEKAPLEERPFFIETIKYYKNDPSPNNLMSLSKYIDRINVISKSGVGYQVVPYKRPDWLAPKQHEIADRVQEDKNLSVDGDRQTGKDTAVGVGVFEDCIMSETHWFFMASKEDTAIKIMKKIISEARFKYVLPHIVSNFQKKIVFKTQDLTYSTLEIIDTTEAAVKGITGNLWMDDVDTIIKNHKEDVITKAIMITRSNPLLHIVFTSNMGKGAYQSLLNVFHNYPKMIKCITLTKDDVPHINATTDEFLYDTATALSGESEAQAQLMNAYNADGDCFDPSTVNAAMENYQYLSPKIRPLKVVLAIDPSGMGHPMGWIIMGICEEKIIYEIDSGEMQVGAYSDITRETWTQDRINEFFVKKILEHQVDTAICESNMNGQTIMAFLRTTRKVRNIRVEPSNFGAATNANAVGNFISLAREFFDSGRIYIKSEKLAGELRCYNPSISKGTKDKGDLADAMLHCIWKLVNGLQYIQQKVLETHKYKHFTGAY